VLRVAAVVDRAESLFVNLTTAEVMPDATHIASPAVMEPS
jgi:hypothetical protein